MPDTIPVARPAQPRTDDDRPADPWSAVPQFVAGALVPLAGLLFFKWLLAPRRPRIEGTTVRVVALTVFAGAWVLFLTLNALMFAALGMPPFKDPPSFTSIAAFGSAGLRGLLAVVQIEFTSAVLLDWAFWWAFARVSPDLPAFDRGVRWRVRVERGFWRFLGTLFTVGFSVLPLTALLVALPAAAPREAVLSDTVRPARTRFGRFAQRVGAALAGVLVLVALFASAIELVSRLPLPESGQLAALARKAMSAAAVDFLPNGEPPGHDPDAEPPTPQELVDKQKQYRNALRQPDLDPTIRTDTETALAKVTDQIEAWKPTSRKLRVMLDPVLAPYLAVPIWTLLPPALVQHWPFVLLLVYGLDLALLLLIGRVPLAYNFRYLWVRKRDTALTAMAFTVVVALVVVLLAFVNGMYRLNENTGIPGNVLVLSDGATDELFSNLGYGDVSNVERVVVADDEKGLPLTTPLSVQAATPGPDGKLVNLPPGATDEAKAKAVRLASFETYLVLNQPVPVKEGEKPRRRFLQVRAMKNAAVAAAVHNVELEPGGAWFNDAGVEAGEGDKTYLQAVIGAGAASTLGADVGKARLGVGDVFALGDREWKVVGVMKSEGTTFGSEIWTSVNNAVVQGSGKGNKYTTLVLRATENTVEASRAVAYHLQNRYTQTKLKAYAEPEYYKELTKTNEQFLTWIMMLAGVMAVGGVFGVMNTMFASIAARIKEVGVLRILGFKRWQILISFMLESLAIAAVGGAVGCGIGYLANGFEASSTLSSGQGGKSVALNLVVDYQTVAAGMLFTLVMGRLGGLVPALSAMRMEILDSLR